MPGDVSVVILPVSPIVKDFSHVKQTLTEKLAIDNPRFDAKRELP